MAEKVIPPEPQVRVMRPDDLEAVVEIDAQVFGQRRPEYYERKMALALDETQQLVTSLVIEVEGKVVGFIMGEVYLGEFGVPETTATIDTIGVGPAYQGRGVGTTLFEEYASHLRKQDRRPVHHHAGQLERLGPAALLREGWLHPGQGGESRTGAGVVGRGGHVVRWSGSRLPG
jgi:ribosomal protein S18 acetylase RimI-like enzyme